jgi:hypothetical protein
MEIFDHIIYRRNLNICRNRDEPSSVGSCTRMSFHLGRYNDTWEVEDCERGLAKYFVCDEVKTDTTISNKQSLPTFSYDNAGAL